MTNRHVAALSAAILIAVAFAVPAKAASGTNLAAKNVWATMDKCNKTAIEKYPDETADALAKRDAYVHTCQRDGRTPVREAQSPKK